MSPHARHRSPVSAPPDGRAFVEVGGLRVRYMGRGWAAPGCFSACHFAEEVLRS